MSDGREIVKPPKDKPDYSEWKFRSRQVYVLDGTVVCITRVGGDGSVPGNNNIDYAEVQPDGSLARGHWISPWQLRNKLEDGAAVFIDGARAYTVVTLPPEYAAQVERQREAQRKAKHAKMERGLDPLDDKEPESHPSYGTITLTRGSSTGRHLFGSAFKHHHTISIDICRATMNRGHSNDRHFSGAEIARIEMSEAQFAHFITSVAVGEGTPCTLYSVFGEKMPDPPAAKETEKFHEDARRDLRVASQHVVDAIEKAKALVDKPGTVTKTDRKAILDSLFYAEKALNDSMPFTITQFNRHMEKIVSAGKHEIDAYLTRLTQRAGTALPPISLPALTDGEEGIVHLANTKFDPYCGAGTSRGDSVSYDGAAVTCPECREAMCGETTR